MDSSFQNQTANRPVFHVLDVVCRLEGEEWRCDPSYERHSGEGFVVEDILYSEGKITSWKHFPDVALRMFFPCHHVGMFYKRTVLSVTSTTSSKLRMFDVQNPWSFLTYNIRTFFLTFCNLWPWQHPQNILWIFQLKSYYGLKCSKLIFSLLGTLKVVPLSVWPSYMAQEAVPDWSIGFCHL